MVERIIPTICPTPVQFISHIKRVVYCPPFWRDSINSQLNGQLWKFQKMVVFLGFPQTTLNKSGFADPAAFFGEKPKIEVLNQGPRTWPNWCALGKVSPQAPFQRIGANSHGITSVPAFAGRKNGGVGTVSVDFARNRRNESTNLSSSLHFPRKLSKSMHFRVEKN